MSSVDVSVIVVVDGKQECVGGKENTSIFIHKGPTSGTSYLSDQATSLSDSR